MPKPPITITIDPDEMALRGRIGAHVVHRRYDSRELTAAGRAAFVSKFEDEVDPGRVLPDAERQRGAEHAGRAHFAKLARLSANARRTKKEHAAASTPVLAKGPAGGAA